MNISRGVISEKIWLNLKKLIKDWKCPKGICDWKCRALAILRMFWCFLLTTEFCCTLSIQGWKEITLLLLKKLETKSSGAFDFKLSSN